MPERGPSLINSLRLHLRYEIEHLLAHDADYVALPRLQIACVLHDEADDVFLRSGGEAHIYSPQRLSLRALVGSEAKEVIEWCRGLGRLPLRLLLILGAGAGGLNGGVGVYVLLDG